MTKIKLEKEKKNILGNRQGFVAQLPPQAFYSDGKIFLQT